MRKRRIGECAYCGRTAELTKDHVIPKCLFLKPRPKPIVVDACEACNNEKSKTDDLLRDFLISDAFTSESVTAQRLQVKLLSSARQGSSTFAKIALKDARPHSFVTPGGVYLGEDFSVSVDLTEIFARIIRGLFYRLHSTRIPQTYEFELQRLDPLRCSDGIEAILKMGYYARFRVGKEFFANLMVSDQDPFSTMWLMCFYESVWIFAETTPPPV